MKGNRIKLLREEHKLKQEDLAKILSISTSAVGMYERDEREPNDDLTIKLAEYFGVSTDFLLGKSDVRNPDEIDDKLNVAFSSGYNGLNETNKNIINGIISTLQKEQNKENK